MKDKMPIPPTFIRESLIYRHKRPWWSFRKRFTGKKLSNQQVTDIMTYVVEINQSDWATMLLTRLVRVHPYLERDNHFKLQLNRFHDSYIEEINNSLK